MPNLSYLPRRWKKIYKLADQMDKMQKIDQRETHWSEEELIDLFGKKTIH